MQVDDVSRGLLHVQDNSCGQWFFLKFSFSQLDRILILMIKGKKKLEIGKIHFKTHLSACASLTKKNLFYTIPKIKKNINDMDQDIVFKKNLAHNCKLGMKK